MITLLLLACASPTPTPSPIPRDSNTLQPGDVQVVAVDGVPDGAFLVYDETDVYPYFVWTNPIEAMSQIDVGSLHIETFPDSGDVSDPDATIGSGTEDLTSDITGHDDEDVPDPSIVPILTIAYAGDVPVDGQSVQYEGPPPMPLDGSVPPPTSCSSWQVEVYGTKRVAMYGNGSTTFTATVYHKHSTNTTYHLLSSGSFKSCWYAYDCVSSSMTMEYKVCASVDTDWTDATFTTCKLSCY